MSIDPRMKARKTGPKVLILSASVGSGHTRAAQAVQLALFEEGSGVGPVEVRDFLETASWPYRLCYRFLYLTLARHAPLVLDLLYDLTDSMPPWLRKSLLIADRRQFGRVLSDILADPPDLVPCTHFLPLELFADLKIRGTFSGSLWGVVTDVHPHGIWVHDGVDRYIVATPEAAAAVSEISPPGTAVEPLGIPVHPDFVGSRLTGEEDRIGRRNGRRLPHLFTVLVLSGGYGIGSLIPVLDSFRGLERKVSLVVVAGKNPSLLRRCRKWERDHRGVPVRVLGFVPDLHEWMALSDLVVTKPGGLTVFEALALEKPLVLLPARGGQERRNREAVLDAGAGVGVDREREVGPVVRDLLGSPDRLSSMAVRSGKLGKPGAALSLAGRIAEWLGPEGARGAEVPGGGSVPENQGGKRGEVPVGFHL